jgi:hypothetical protein
MPSQSVEVVVETEGGEHTVLRLFGVPGYFAFLSGFGRR